MKRSDDLEEGATLPASWTLCTVGDTGEYLNGMAFKPRDWTGKGLPIIRIQNLTDPNKPINKTQRAFDPKYRIRHGDILVSWSATLDAFRWHGGDAILNQHIFKVHPNIDLVDDQYLFYSLRYQIRKMIRSEHMHGSTMRHINRGPFLAHEFPLPPRNEQKRIASKIDELFSRICAGEDALKRAKRLVDRYRKSVLKACATGEITRDWRDKHKEKMEPATKLLKRILKARGDEMLEEPEFDFLESLPPNWVATRISAVGSVQLGRQRAPKFHTGAHMRPYLRVANVFEARFDLSDVMSMNFTPAEFEQYKLRRGDIFLNEGQSRELVGRPALYTNELPGGCFTNSLVRFRAGDNVLPEFALIVFRYYLHAGFFMRIARITTNIAHLGGERFASMSFPVPSLEEQKEITDRFNTLWSEIDAASTWIEKTLKTSSANEAFDLKVRF